MKKSIILGCALLGCTALGAQERGGGRADRTPEGLAGLTGVEFHHFALTSQKIDLIGKETLVFAPIIRGVALTTGHSFLVHEKPLARIARFGFDINWFDIEYGNWWKKIDSHNKWMHKLDLAMGIGPAVHLSPFDRIGVHGYFRYSPTISLVAHNFAGGEEGKFELVAGYASYFSAGLAVSWSAFSLGGEYRFGRGVYNGIRIPDVTVSPKEIDELANLNIKDVLDKERHRMSGWRLCFGFRF